MPDDSSERLLPLLPIEHDEDATTLHDDQSVRMSCDYDMTEVSKITKTRAPPVHVFVLYGLSWVVSVAGLACCAYGYAIAISGPFDEGAREKERQSYEANFFGMKSIWVFLLTNILYTGLNLTIAFRGTQARLCFLNMVYDFFFCALLITFGVLNMVEMLWDRRLCDGLVEEGRGDLYTDCDAQMFEMLLVELLATNFGLLVAVIHFFLLVARCCNPHGRKGGQRSIALQSSIREEERLLETLIGRRRLLAENEALEARKNAPLPALPTEEQYTDIETAVGEPDEVEETEEQDDLIYMSPH
ncbi:hypothetical protein BJ878DRAFT_215388 [Calycina marina]|uniref:Uncharacterized protein n=1 Tax=Calycina marina TaxID=1763456 RepID=A0A9P7YYN9_9HELO|nr:hypothetical protein BJ878DRAFT_215388 [Calycina marina]